MAISFDLGNITGAPQRTRADDVRAMFEPYNRTMQQWEMAKADVSRVSGAPRLQVLQQRYDTMKSELDSMASALKAEQSAVLSNIAAQRSAALKAGGRSGGLSAKDKLKALELGINAYKGAGALQPETGLRDFAAGMGTLDASLMPIASKIALDPEFRESMRTPGATFALTSLQLGEEEGKAFSSSRAGYINGQDPGEESLRRAKKIGDAVGLVNATMEFSGGVGDITPKQRAGVEAAIAEMYGLKPGDLSAESLEKVRNVVQMVAQDTAQDSTERTALQQLGAELTNLAAGGGAAGGGGSAAARVRIPNIPRLSPQMQADLEKYLTALSDDGMVVAGELTGMGHLLTEDDIQRGKAAYDEAKRIRAYAPGQASLFNDTYLTRLRQLSDRNEKVLRQTTAVLDDYEMDSVQRQQIMARQFLDAENMAEGLRVPLDYEAYGSAFERDVMGEMMDIVQKEGELVYETGALPADRERRLGGRGSSARAPHRFAKQMYSMDKSRAGGVGEADIIPLINKRFRDPRDQERALAYFLAMKEVDTIRAQTRRPVEAGQPMKVAAQLERTVQPEAPAPLPQGRTRGVQAAAPVAPPPDFGTQRNRQLPSFRMESPDPLNVGESSLAEELPYYPLGIESPMTDDDALVGRMQGLGQRAVGLLDPYLTSSDEIAAEQVAEMQGQMGSALSTVGRNIRRGPVTGLNIDRPEDYTARYGPGADLDFYRQDLAARGTLTGEVTGLDMRSPEAYTDQYGPGADLDFYRQDQSANRTPMANPRYLARDAFLFDVEQPYDGQVNAPQAGMNGSRNTGAPRKMR